MCDKTSDCHLLNFYKKTALAGTGHLTCYFNMTHFIVSGVKREE